MAARLHDTSLGFSVMGPLGMLVLRELRGEVQVILPLIEPLQSAGQRLRQSAFADALAVAGKQG